MPKSILVQATHGIIDGIYLWNSFDRYDDTTGLCSSLVTNAHQSLVINIAGVVFLASLSLLVHMYSARASWCYEQQRQKWSRLVTCITFIVALWPYFRDGFSGLKNGHHAYATSTALGSALGHISLHLINPVGIGVGVLLAVVLLWRRYINQKRDKAIRYNIECAQKIKEGKNSPLDVLLEEPNFLKRVLYYLAALFDGLTDGLYLFGCVASLCLVFHLNVFSLGVPLIIATVLLLVWTAMSVIARMMEEHDRQCQLDQSINLVNNALDGFNECQKPKNKVTTVFKIIRTILNCIKNAQNCIVMVLSLVLRYALSVVAAIIGVTVVGLVLGVAYAVMMVYDLFIPEKPQTQCDSTRADSAIVAQGGEQHNQAQEPKFQREDINQDQLDTVSLKRSESMPCLFSKSDHKGLNQLSRSHSMPDLCRA